MSFIRKLEEAAAKKLRRIFLNANKRADYAVADIERLEKELSDARAKSVEAARDAYESAVQASEKAHKVAQELMLEVKACAERLKHLQDLDKH